MTAAQDWLERAALAQRIGGSVGCALVVAVVDDRVVELVHLHDPAARSRLGLLLAEGGTPIGYLTIHVDPVSDPHCLGLRVQVRPIEGQELDERAENQLLELASVVQVVTQARVARLLREA